MVTTLLLAGAAIAITVVGLLRARDLCAVSPFVVLLVTGCLVAIAYPLGSSFVEVRSWRSLEYVSEAVVRACQVDWLAYLSGLVLATFVGRPREGGRPTEAPLGDAGLRYRDTFLATGLILIGLLLYVQMFRSLSLADLMDYENFAAKHRNLEGMGMFVYGIYAVAIGCFWAEAGAVSPRVRLMARLVAGGLVGWSVLVLGQRSYAVLVLLGYASIFARSRGWRIRSVHPALLVGVPLLWIFLETFALSRGLYVDSWIGALQEAASRLWTGEFVAAVIGGSEFTAPFVTAGEIRHAVEAGMLDGYNPVQGLQTLVPRALHPDRPPTLAQWFAANFYPELAARGGAAAFSIVAEAWLAFGHVLGPGVYGFALGWLSWRLEGRIAAGPTSLIARFSPFLLYPALISQRSASEVLMKTVITGWFLVVFVASLRWLFGRRLPQGAAPLVPESSGA